MNRYLFLILIFFTATIGADTPPPPNNYIYSASSAPPTPSSGRYKLWLKDSDQKIYTLNSSGVSTAYNGFPNFTSSYVLYGDGSGTPITSSSFTYSSGTLTVPNFAGSLIGNANTATALAANPTDCTSNQFATAIAANGNLTCAQPLFTDISGTLAETRGGTGQTTYTFGDMLYASATNTLSKLAGQITTTKKYLSQTGTGSGSAAPVWSQVDVGDLSGTLGIGAGGTGQTTKAAAYNALAPTSSAGDIAVYGASGNVRVPSGADSEVLTADSTQTNGLHWAQAPPPSSAKNYIYDPEFKSGTEATVFDDGTSYVDGTGGSPTTVSISQDFGNNLGITSLKISKAATSCVGEGVTLTTTTISKRDAAQGYLLTKFDYDFSAMTAGDWRLRAYDVTDNTLITSIEPLVGLDTNAGFLKAQTQALARVNILTTARQIRWSAYCNTDATSASAISGYLSNVQVTPNQTSQGAIQTAWASFPMVLSAATTAPVRGTVVTDNAQWRRNGDTLEMTWTYRQSSAGTAGSGPYFFGLPIVNGTQLTADTSKVTVSTIVPTTAATMAYGGTVLGSATVAITATGDAAYNATSQVYLCSTSTFCLVGTSSQIGASYGISSSGGNGNFGSASLFITVNIKVPVTQWPVASTTQSTTDANLQTPDPLSTTSSVVTPSVAGQWPVFATNSLNLTPGRWVLNCQGSASSPGAVATYSAAAVGYFGANGSGLSSAPTTFVQNLTGVTLLGGASTSTPYTYWASGSADATINNAPTMTIRTTALSTVVYCDMYSTETTPANARLQTIFQAQRQPDLTVFGLYPSPPTQSIVTPTSHTGNFSANSTGTYTPSPGTRLLRIKMWGGGGGGSGGGNNPGTGLAGTSGGATTFGTSLLAAAGGGFAAINSTNSPTQGAGGTTVTVNAPAITVVSQPGASGTAGFNCSASNCQSFGIASGAGGATPMGGAGGGIYTAATALSAVLNSGSGGGGGGVTPTVTVANVSGAGGGAAAYIEALIANPAVSYTYSVGAKGSGGAGGTNGSGGGSGGDGAITITEEY